MGFGPVMSDDALTIDEPTRRAVVAPLIESTDRIVESTTLQRHLVFTGTRPWHPKSIATGVKLWPTRKVCDLGVMSD